MRQLFAAKVSVQAAQAVESLLSKPASRLCRYHDPGCVTDNDVFDIAPAIDKNTDLATNFS